MILTLITAILCCVYKYLLENPYNLPKLSIYIFFGIMIFSYFLLSLFKKIIEKFTDIEFLNGNELLLAVAYHKKYFYGYSDNTIYEICNVFSLFTFDGKINS